MISATLRMSLLGYEGRETRTVQIRTRPLNLTHKHPHCIHNAIDVSGGLLRQKEVCILQQKGQAGGGDCTDNAVSAGPANYAAYVMQIMHA